MDNGALIAFQIALQLTPSQTWYGVLTEFVKNGGKFTWPIALTTIFIASLKFIIDLIDRNNTKHKTNQDHEYRMGLVEKNIPHTTTISPENITQISVQPLQIVQNNSNAEPPNSAFM